MKEHGTKGPEADRCCLSNAHPVVFVASNGLDLEEPDRTTVARVNEGLGEAFSRVHPGGTLGQTLIKVHVGEPKCVTRMNPSYAASSVRFLEENGASGIVAGDTTVAYTGPRGHRQNPPGDASSYLELAQNHGWSAEGPAGVDFVVLDRPSTSVPGKFEFRDEGRRERDESIQRFKSFHVAGGFASADFVVNHAHLTLHGLAGLAGCMKSVAMGCSSLPGKLMMHQSLLPHFDTERCGSCGKCVKNCPEGALELKDDNSPPALDPSLCIGCGECEAVCAKGKNAVHLEGEDITDWQRGERTLPLRMADYALGLLNAKWDNTVHVLHMYTVTERCDCLDVRQEPMVRRSLGFLVGKNPFAVDRMGGQILAEALREEGREIDGELLRTAETSARYVQDSYGIPADGPRETIKL